MKISVKAISKRSGGFIQDFVVVSIGGVDFLNRCHTSEEARKLVLYISKQLGLNYKAKGK